VLPNVPSWQPCLDARVYALVRGLLIFASSRSSDRQRTTAMGRDRSLDRAAGISPTNGPADQEIKSPSLAPAIDPTSPLERALARFGAALAAKEGIEQEAGG
jgi:hypothetical protein